MKYYIIESLVNYEPGTIVPFLFTSREEAELVMQELIRRNSLPYTDPNYLYSSCHIGGDYFAMHEVEVVSKLNNLLHPTPLGRLMAEILYKASKDKAVCEKWLEDKIKELYKGV